ncbi:MAG: type I-MYXAN CRISPR-associated protein Cas6/Cmx6 [Gammaproteobacteria bacterium]|nr:type I-MYXAN CRISPR-associated protein Cas6/Cmx6 [Gammaproteobacteria bacterium]MDH5735327.1 type I-MYXAN CRISPR-associated protein Cas6/Cmx6 [Gammaproteobacteria bacterium]
MSLFWHEEDDKYEFQLPDTIVDLSFNIDCKKIGLDHAYDLSVALSSALPWLMDEEDAGVHLIHGASSGNGWVRPEESGDEDFIYLSHRARMQLRVPRERIADTQILTGQVLDVGGYRVSVGKSQIKPLTTMGTLFARYIQVEQDETEDLFLERVVNEMRSYDISVKKVLCGIDHEFRLPEGKVKTISLMVADLDPKDAFTLQHKGLGAGRKMGFGLFIPHKGIKPVGDMSEKSHFSGT